MPTSGPLQPPGPMPRGLQPRGHLSLVLLPEVSCQAPEAHVGLVTRLFLFCVLTLFSGHVGTMIPSSQTPVVHRVT